MLALRPLPEAQRAAWAALFEHYVFGAPGAAVDHLPPDRRALLADLDPAVAAALRAVLREKLDGNGG